MIRTAQALTQFFGSFGIPAYNENSIPDDAEPPYITYPLREPEWNSKCTFWAIVYYRHKDSNLDSLTKADEIAAAIGTGIRLPIEGGYVVIWPETPLVQSMTPNGDIRPAYINLSLNAYHMPGI